MECERTAGTLYLVFACFMESIEQKRSAQDDIILHRMADMMSVLCFSHCLSVDQPCPFWDVGQHTFSWSARIVTNRSKGSYM